VGALLDQRARDEGDAPVPEPVQVRNGERHPGVVVDRDAVGALLARRQEHRGDPRRAQRLQHGRVAAELQQSHAAHRPLEQTLDSRGLEVEPAVGVADHRRVPRGRGVVLERLDQLGVERIGQVADDDPDRPRSQPDQVAGEAVGAVAERVDRGEDAAAGDPCDASRAA
jgi:hypothetical protein